MLISTSRRASWGRGALCFATALLSACSVKDFEVMVDDVVGCDGGDCQKSPDGGCDGGDCRAPAAGGCDGGDCRTPAAGSCDGGDCRTPAAGGCDGGDCPPPSDCAGECEPGEKGTDDQSQACGRCGQTRRTRVCTDGCAWGDWQEVCEDEDVTAACALQMVDDDIEACGKCGQRKRTRQCGADCTWGDYGDWGPCEGEGEGECAPGETMTDDNAPCGLCGTRVSTRVCGDDCRWDDWDNASDCGGEGGCEPGKSDGDPQGCGLCGTLSRTRVCDEQCRWGEYGEPSACENQGECEPATTDTPQEEACGLCGKRTRTRVCSETCGWGPWSEWSACQQAPDACQPGSTSPFRSVACGSCGTQLQVRTCGNNCQWGAWQDSGACKDVALCAPEETGTQYVPCGRCGMQAQVHTCGNNCQWSGWTNTGGCTAQGPCEPGKSDTPESRACTCGPNEQRTRTCNASCQWGDWGNWTGCAKPETNDPCRSLGELTWEPKIDGKLECGLSLRALKPQGWTEPNAPLPPGNSARYAAAWHRRGLYVFVEVTDPDRMPAVASAHTYCGDAVDVYLDVDGNIPRSGKFEYPGTGQLIFAAPKSDSDTSTRVNGYANTASRAVVFDRIDARTAGVFPTAAGYVLEALVTPAMIDTPVSGIGDRIGWSIGVHVSDSTGTHDDLLDNDDTACDGQGRRLGQYYLRLGDGTGCSGGDPYCDTTAFCTPTLD